MRHGCLDELRPKQQDEDAHPESRQVLDASMPKGSVGLGLHPGKVEGKRQKKPAADVAKVVDGVRTYGGGVRPGGREPLCDDH